MQIEEKCRRCSCKFISTQWFYQVKLMNVWEIPRIVQLHLNNWVVFKKILWNWINFITHYFHYGAIIICINFVGLIFTLMASCRKKDSWEEGKIGSSCIKYLIILKNDTQIFLQAFTRVKKVQRNAFKGIYTNPQIFIFLMMLLNIFAHTLFHIPFHSTCYEELNSSSCSFVAVIQETARPSHIPPEVVWSEITGLPKKIITRKLIFYSS